MKIHLLIIILCVCTLQKSYSQEEETDGVSTSGIPVRNSLTLNRFIINPTFSFVREEHKYISVFSKREWTQFENAPVTYLASYSGRFSENIGAGLGLFQQNIGILTTFGGVLNFAYNVPITRDSNLTFGLNLGAYKSGINNSNVVTNFDDPSLQDINNNFLITINPAVTYGLEVLDIGLSFNNIVTYNFESSDVVQDDPEQSLELYLQYTGYMYARGFFDDSKFTGLLKSELRNDETIISGIAMLTVPKGIWGQVGYNSRYGVSAGFGVNITKAIAVEYNYETDPFGDLNEFGASHDITFTYRIKNYDRYDYGSNDEVVGLISTDKKPKSKSSASKKEKQTKIAEQKAQEEAEAQAKLLAEQKAQVAAEAQAKLRAEQKAQEEAEAQAKLRAEQKAQEAAEAQAKLRAEQKAQEAAESQAKLRAEQKAQEAAEAQAKLLAEQKAQEAAEAQAKLRAEQKAQEAAEAQAKLIAEQKAQEEAEAQAKLLAEQKPQEEAEAQAKLLAEQKAQEEAEAQAKLLAEQKAQEEAEAQAKLLAEQKAQEEAKAQAILIAEQKAQEEAEAQAKLLAEQKAQEEAEAQAKLLAEQKAQEEAEAQAKLLAEQKAQEEAEAQAKLLAEQKAQEEEKAKEELITKPKDKVGKEMLALSQQTDSDKASQNQLLEQFNAIINVKNQDLKDLKEENDLSEQGVTVAPKPFKSISAENKVLNQIKTDLDNTIENRNKTIKELQELYEDNIETDTIYNEEVFLFYRKKLKQLKTEQAEAMALKTDLEVSLKKIRFETNIERKRRIKRAAFDNEEKRYAQDRSALERIKRNTVVTNDNSQPEDFDIGEKPSKNIQILKNVKNVENGYYLIIAIHSNKSKRDEFLTKVVSTGDKTIDFFFDVNTSKYYIYTKKLNSINEANYAIKNKTTKPYNTNMSLVKIEN